MVVIICCCCYQCPLMLAKCSFIIAYLHTHSHKIAKAHYLDMVTHFTVSGNGGYGTSSEGKDT